MKEEGVVIRIKDGTAVIEVSPREECSKCCSCGASGSRQVIAGGDTAEKLRVGDRVEVNINTSAMMRIYILLYAMPLAAFAGTVLIAYALSGEPLVSFIAALSATLIVYILVGRYIRKARSFLPSVEPLSGNRPK
jgi:positive regulator of sigma E activity